MDEIVIPYFWNNSFYEMNGIYYDEEYSHGPMGVVEGYRDIFQIKDDLQIAKIMYHYIGYGKLHVHDQCYCGSGLPLIKCYQGLHDKCYRAFRKISKDQIKVDLSSHFIAHLKLTGVLNNSLPK